MENRKELDFKKGRFCKVVHGKLIPLPTIQELNEDKIIFDIPEMTTVNIKPMSVNEAWQGQRYKTDKYKAYQKELLLMLPNINFPHGKLKIFLEFGMSNSLSDIDNPVKQILDCLQKKYFFNDRDIYEMEVKKVKTEKGKEYFKFAFITITNATGNKQT